MKKILTGVIAAAALLFGFVSCSGDLHDKVVTKLEFGSDYYLAGDMTNWEEGPLIPMTADESDPAKFWAVFDATGEAQNFCFTKDASWTGQIGGNLISAGTLGKDIKYESKDNGFGGFNANLSGLVSGNTYKLVATATNDGTIQIDCAESKAPNYFLLDGFYLKGSFDKGWAFDKKKVLMDGVKDTATGDVTYKVTIIATNTEEKACIARFDDSVTYKGVSVSAKDGEAKKLSTDGGDIEFTDLEIGKGYFVNVVTSVDETVKISIKEAASIQIIGVQVVGLNNADYEGKTFIFGGGQIGWPSDWDGSEATATTVKNGVATVKLETPKKLYETGTKITIMGTVKGDWNCKIASLYKQNSDENKDGSIDISKFAIDYTDYIIYADVTGLNSGDKVEWKLVKPTVTVSVTGLPADANGKELYFTGDFNKWTEPAKEGTYKVTVADGSISLVASVDAKSSGKFAAAGWKKPEICALDAEKGEAANISWQDLSFGKTLKGVYSKTLTKDDGDVYICNWTVE